VFVGDVVYHKSGSKYIVSGAGIIDIVDWSEYTWQPPKKTFLLNGVELPCHSTDYINGYFLEIDAGIEGKRKRNFLYSNKDDRNKVADALIELLSENTK